MDKSLTQKVHQIINSRNLILFAIILLLTAITIYFLSIPHKQTTSNSDHTYTTTGVVTLKVGSCSGERLLPNNTIKTIKTICDGGNWLTVNDTRISTGGGALRGGSPERMFNIDNIHPGNWVEIRYAKDDGYNYWTTDCKSCYVKLR